jgi:hypothetical protein
MWTEIAVVDHLHHISGLEGPEGGGMTMATLPLFAYFVMQVFVDAAN